MDNLLAVDHAHLPPLVDSEGTAIGALQIDTLDQRGRFTKDDLELLVSVASQAAIAIDNAQLVV